MPGIGCRGLCDLVSGRLEAEAVEFGHDVRSGRPPASAAGFASLERVVGQRLDMPLRFGGRDARAGSGEIGCGRSAGERSEEENPGKSPPARPAEP